MLTGLDRLLRDETPRATIPLEVVGAPQFPVEAVLSKMRAMAPEWCEGCYLRPCFFEPFFDKYTPTLIYR